MRTNKATKYDRQVDREIEKAISGFTQHLVSNSKWVRLISHLVAHMEKIKMELKQVHLDRERDLYLYDDMELGFDYWPSGFEILPYKEIEYAVFPRIIDPLKNQEQDIDHIERLINQVGQFDLERTERGLKLTCYKK